MPATPANAHAITGMINRLNRPDYDRWAAQIRATGGCRQPIHLRGKVDHYDQATGQLLHRYTTNHRTRRHPARPLQDPPRLPLPRLRRDLPSRHLPTHPRRPDRRQRRPRHRHRHTRRLFVTLTAPSFGTVHTRRENNGKVLPCHARRNAATCPHGRVMSCTERHSTDDPRLGEPLCPDCYDYAGSVLFNALAPQLWKRFTDALRRHLAKTRRPGPQGAAPPR